MPIVGIDHVQLAMPAGEEARARAGLLVKQLRSIVALCRERGFRVVDDEPLEGYDRVYVDDPFGNRLELMEKR